MFPRRFLCLALICCASLACAEEGEDSYIKRWLSTDAANMPPPTEEAFEMPELAKLKDWRVYDAGRQMGNSRVEIAVDSVSINKDRILRYAIAVIPSSGLRNVFFEGLDCFSARYRNYAWGNPDKTWRKTEALIWRVPKEGVRNTWQATMINDFCGDTGPYKLDVIVNSLKKGTIPSKDYGPE